MKKEECMVFREHVTPEFLDLQLFLHIYGFISQKKITCIMNKKK